jgi:osmotically-inducible protein OsmY
MHTNPKKFLPYAVLAFTLAFGCLIGCSSQPRSPDVTGPIRQSLNQAGLNDVSVSQDRDKGVVTLDGHVPDDPSKAQAETIARSNAAGQVVANEIAVIPPGVESDAKKVNSDVDDGIKKNLDAALIQNNLHKSVKYDVKNGVVTLSGDVRSETRRNSAASIAQGVPNVQQVVNELQVKDQKATSTN